MGPYRTHSEETTAPPGPVAELLVPFAALWLLSLARVVAAYLAGRAFDAQDTLALLALVLLPWLLFARRRATSQP